MKTKTKLIIGSIAALAAGAAGYIYTRKKNQASEPDLIDPTVLPEPGILTPKTNKTATAPASLNYDSPFTKADKAHVQIMQKMLGATPDGAWGAKTEALIPKGLSRPFSLNQLKTALSNISLLAAKASNVKKSGLKVGDSVYAAYTTDVEVTKGAKYKDLKWMTTGAKRTQEVSKGQYLGKIVVLNPNSVLILNGFNELVLAPYAKISKNQLSGLGGQTDLL